tara:strand:- start:1308 stop:1601 length:294 start_codon:yes stop_codon:yes gene_type:complete
MNREVSSRAEREDDVWKFNESIGTLIGSDGILYAYFKTVSYVYIDEVNGIGLNDEAVSTIEKAKQGGHDFYIDIFTISMDYIAFLFVEDDNDNYLMN